MAVEVSSQFFDPDDFEVVVSPSKPVDIAKPVSISAPVDEQPVTSDKPKFFELKPVGSPVTPINALLIQETPVIKEPAVAVDGYKLPTGITMPESIELPSDFPSFQAPEGYHVDLSDLPLGSKEPMTRRQLREMEKLIGSELVADNEPDYEVELPFTSDLAEQVPLESEAQPSLVEPISYNNEAMFTLSPGLLVEPTTNSIVIDQVQDLTNYTATVTETGEILTTGAIQLPILHQDTETGEVSVIAEAEKLDEAIALDSATGFINTIAPMRVTGIVNAAKKFRVIPTNLQRGKNHPYLVLTAAIVMVAIGGLTVAAFMLKII